MLGILCSLCLLVSCDWLESKESKTQKLVDKEMQEIDFNEVDQYPLFNECDETASKTAQKACFENTLLRHFSETLKDYNLILEQDIDESIYVDFLINSQGAISILDIERNITLSKHIPEMNTLIAQSLSNLPNLHPALKRGMPVNAKFRIPIVIKTGK